MAEIKKLQSGDVLFKEGDFEMCMYDIIKGDIGIYSNDKQVAVLHEGSLLGEIGLLDSISRSATAIAETDADVAVITTDNIAEYFQNDPSKIVDIFKSISTRLREVSDEYVEACKTISEYVATENPSEGLGSKIKKLLGGRK